MQLLAPALQGLHSNASHACRAYTCGWQVEKVELLLAAIHSSALLLLLLLLLLASLKPQPFPPMFRV
jgi:hypothetical protein